MIIMICLKGIIVFTRLIVMQTWFYFMGHRSSQLSEYDIDVDNSQGGHFFKVHISALFYKCDE